VNLTRFGFKLSLILVFTVISSGPPLRANDSNPVAYEIGNIPQLSVWQGEIVRLALLAPKKFDHPSFTFKANPSQTGKMLIDEHGVFTFAPSKEDKFEFEITFTATSSTKKQVSQVVRLAPLSHLLSEYDVIESRAALPSQDEDLAYTETISSRKEYLNHEERLTRSVEVSGKVITFDEHKDINHLYEKLNHPYKTTSTNPE
jgi:hypothetical protein